MRIGLNKGNQGSPKVFQGLTVPLWACAVARFEATSLSLKPTDQSRDHWLASFQPEDSARFHNFTRRAQVGFRRGDGPRSIAVDREEE